MPQTPEVHVVARIKQVGNSLALFIPAAEARKAGLREGQPVDVRIRKEVPSPLGLLKDVEFQPFVRSKGGLWRDRI